MATRLKGTHFLFNYIAVWIHALKMFLVDMLAPNEEAPAVVATIEAINAPAAAGVTVRAAVASDSTTAVTSGITNPAIPRGVQVVFHASWDGGNVEVSGTDQWGNTITETITAAAGSTVQGVKVFKTVTSVRNTAAGAGGTATFTTQTGTLIGLANQMAAAGGMAMVGGAADNATFNANAHGVTFATAPNGSRNYVVVYPVGRGTYAPYHYDLGEFAVTTANASSLDTSIALCKALLVSVHEHLRDTLAHAQADTTNELYGTDAELADALNGITTLAAVQSAANAMKAALNAHWTESGVHVNDDANSTIASADASDQSSANTLLNEIKSVLNGHMERSLPLPSWRILRS